MRCAAVLLRNGPAVHRCFSTKRRTSGAHKRARTRSASAERAIITPRFVGERIGLHPLAVIFALLAFAQLFGFVGVLVALPASAVLLVAMRRLRAGYMASKLYQS